MFANLSERLQNALGKLTGKGKLSEKDVDETMREIRLALLEADVNYKVVKDFVKRTKERCIGADVMKSLSPGQMVIKIVHEELVNLMKDDNQKLNFSSKPPTVYMMCGLQGAGKTTHAAKLAKHLKKKNKKPLLVACDIYRPAAIKQLQVVGEQAGVPVFEMGKENPVNIAKAGVKYAEENGYDLVILDTAGRLHIDEDLMQELKNITEAVDITELLLVVDAMTGQDAVNVAKTFNERLEISGVILTKLDGDARGGAALSIRSVTEKPIKFIGTGEKLDDLEPFYPDRLASRILGMGDVLSLIEKAEAQFDKEQAKELEKKIMEQSYDLNDFYAQLQQMKNMGPLSDLIGMMPGVNQSALKNADIDDSQIDKIDAILTSMTDEERRKPEIINSSRRARIAKGSGTTPVDVNRLLKQFKTMKKMMKQVGNMQKKPRKGRMKIPFFK